MLAKKNRPINSEAAEEVAIILCLFFFLVGCFTTKQPHNNAPHQHSQTTTSKAEATHNSNKSIADRSSADYRRSA